MRLGIKTAMREEQYLLQQHLFALEIVTLIYSKIEQNDRQAKKRKQISFHLLSKFYKLILKRY